MEQPPGELRRQFGVWQATALNVTMIVGAGVFITIPLMLQALPGPWALLGWLVAGALILVDGMVWAELGAALPGSGGSYLYLLESYGRDRWGKLMAFLFIWQFMISGPLELASGLISMDTFSQSLSPAWAKFNKDNTFRYVFHEMQDGDLGLTFSPARLGVVAVGGLILLLLYRRVTVLARLTFAFWLAVMGVIGWVLIEGLTRFQPAVALDFPTDPIEPAKFLTGLGTTMALALYSYLGYYNICYVGDEVRDPGKTIPRAVLLSALLVVVLFTLLHLVMLSTIPWREVPNKNLEAYSLPAEFMWRHHGEWAARLISLCLIGSCFASVFAGLLGYSRIPYGAARAGHFFRVVGNVHPTMKIPNISLMLVGGMTLLWSFFDLGAVITALITTRILEQFVAQILGLMILRRLQPDLPRPFRVWLYPLPCLLALAGWLYVYGTSGLLYIGMGLVTLVAGVAVYFVWSWRPRDNDPARLLR